MLFRLLFAIVLGVAGVMLLFCARACWRDLKAIDWELREAELEEDLLT